MAVHQIPTNKPSNTRRYLRRIGKDHVIACRRAAQSKDDMPTLSRRERRALRALNHRATVNSKQVIVSEVNKVKLV